MEDRLTPVLYLEMTEATPEAYATDRVPDVLERPGVERATWWRNVYRDRPDLPRELPEFDTLGVYECEPGFEAPATPSGTTGHHFVRTPRPGQGRLTGKPTVGLSLVLISPSSESDAQALRDWGDFVHINHIVEAGVPGYGRGWRHVFGQSSSSQDSQVLARGRRRRLHAGHSSPEAPGGVGVDTGGLGFLPEGRC